MNSTFWVKKLVSDFFTPTRISWDWGPLRDVELVLRHPGNHLPKDDASDYFVDCEHTGPLSREILDDRFDRFLGSSPVLVRGSEVFHVPRCDTERLCHSDICLFPLVSDYGVLFNVFCTNRPKEVL